MQFTQEQWFRFDEFTENKIREGFDYNREIDGYTLSKNEYSIRVYPKDFQRIHAWKN